MSYCSACDLYFPEGYSLRRHNLVMHPPRTNNNGKNNEEDAVIADSFLKNKQCIEQSSICALAANQINYAHMGDGHSLGLASFELEENLVDFMLYLHAVISEFMYQDRGTGEKEWPDLTCCIHLYDLSDLQLLFWEVRSYIQDDGTGSTYEQFEWEFHEYMENETEDWVVYFTQVLHSEVNTLFWSWQIMRSQWVILEFKKVFGAGFEHIVEMIVLHLLQPTEILHGIHHDAIFRACRDMVCGFCGGRSSCWLQNFANVVR